jgi:hypothetical protein
MVIEWRFQSGKGGQIARYQGAVGSSFFAGRRQIALNLFLRQSTSS